MAEFFGVTEYEIRKAVKLAQLIPPIAEIVENEPKKLNLTCADLIADYDETAQTAFIEMCQIEGYALNKTSPPPPTPPPGGGGGAGAGARPPPPGGRGGDLLRKVK